MKYILLMSGTKAGVDVYRTWSKKDIGAHRAVLSSLDRELRVLGEFVATQGLAAPHEARVVRGLNEGIPITDGIFPESKEISEVLRQEGKGGFFHNPNEAIHGICTDWARRGRGEFRLAKLSR